MIIMCELKDMYYWANLSIGCHDQSIFQINIYTYIVKVKILINFAEYDLFFLLLTQMRQRIFETTMMITL